MKLESEEQQGEASTSAASIGGSSDQAEVKTAGQPLADFLMQLEDYTPTVKFDPWKCVINAINLPRVYFADS